MGSATSPGGMGSSLHPAVGSRQALPQGAGPPNRTPPHRGECIGMGSGAAGGHSKLEQLHLSKGRKLHSLGGGDGSPPAQGRGGIYHCVSVAGGCAPSRVYVHAGAEDESFLGIVLERYLKVFRCLLTICKYLLLWFICCMGHIDSEYRTHWFLVNYM